MYNGGIIKIYRRNVELVRRVAGILLFIYVAAWVLAGVLSNGLLDIMTARAIQSTLDIPTAVALVAYAILSVKLEIEKPKYRALSKNRNNIDTLLVALGLLFIFLLIYIKYVI